LVASPRNDVQVVGAPSRHGGASGRVNVLDTNSPATCRFTGDCPAA
jgi:hypothetical protein